MPTSTEIVIVRKRKKDKVIGFQLGIVFRLTVLTN